MKISKTRKVVIGDMTVKQKKAVGWFMLLQPLFLLSIVYHILYLEDNVPVYCNTKKRVVRKNGYDGDFILWVHFILGNAINLFWFVIYKTQIEVLF